MEEEREEGKREAETSATLSADAAATRTAPAETGTVTAAPASAEVTNMEEGDARPEEEAKLTADATTAEARDGEEASSAACALATGETAESGAIPPVLTLAAEAKAFVENPTVAVVTSPPARGPLTTKNPNSPGPFRNLPHGDCGDGVLNPHPKSEVPDKYWAQRNRLFSRYDEGIQLCKEGWFSVTPEAIADHIAGRMIEIASRTTSGAEQGAEGGSQPQKRPRPRPLVVLDLFCGCGGNLVAFARRPPSEIALVVGVDNDPAQLEMAAHNAAIYGVPANRLLLIKADAIEVLRGYAEGRWGDGGKGEGEGEGSIVVEGEGGVDGGRYRKGKTEALPPRVDAIFLSPPWGGMEYKEKGKGGKGKGKGGKGKNGGGGGEGGKNGKNHRFGYDISREIRIVSSAVASPCKVDDRVERNGAGKPEAAAVAADTAAEETVVNGSDLLRLSSLACSPGGQVAYFLPRNTDAVSLGRAAYRAGYGRIAKAVVATLAGGEGDDSMGTKGVDDVIAAATTGNGEGRVEMERNYLNGKLKTVTAYLSGA